MSHPPLSRHLVNIPTTNGLNVTLNWTEAQELFDASLRLQQQTNKLSHTLYTYGEHISVHGLAAALAEVQTS